MRSKQLIDDELGMEMQAAIFQGPSTFALKTIRVPRLAPGEMLLKVVAVGICGTDLKIFSGRKQPKPLPSGDIILGHELVGEVVVPGNVSSAFSPGQLVMVEPDIFCGQCRYCLSGATNLCVNTKVIFEDYPGAFAQLLTVPESALRNGQVHILPDSLSAEFGTLIEPLACVIHGQERLQRLLPLLDTALILGGGPIGTMHAFYARASGFKSIVIADTNPNRVSLLQAALQDYTDSISVQLINPDNKLNEFGERRFDMVVQACPDVAALQNGFLRIAPSGGLLAFAGINKGEVFSVDAHKLHYQDIHIIGSANYRSSDVRKAIAMLTSEQVPGKILISRRYPLERIQEAMLDAQSGTGLKLIINPN